MTPFIIFVGSSEFRHSLSLCGENRVLLFHKAMLMPTSASRVRYSSTLLRLSIASFSPSAYRIMASSPSSLSRASVSFAKQKQRTLSLSSALPSLSCSAPRWSHGVNWRAPLSLRVQSRTTAPGLERLERKLSTLGIVLLLWIVHTQRFMYEFAGNGGNVKGCIFFG
jgi:hypothetical protein